MTSSTINNVITIYDHMSVHVSLFISQ